MKKLLFLFFLASTVVTVSAQSVQFGITGDIAFDRAASGKLFEGDSKKVQPDMGWSIGAKVRLSSMAGLGLDFGALFAQADKNYTWTADNPSSSSITSVYTAGGKLNYLSIPLNLRFDLKIAPVSKAFIPYAYAGPEFNWFFDGVEYHGAEALENAKNTIDEQTAVWNLNFGFGVILAKHFELSYKYTVHLSDCLELKENAKDQGKRLESRFKDKTNKVALTIYF